MFSAWEREWNWDVHVHKDATFGVSSNLIIYDSISVTYLQPDMMYIIPYVIPYLYIT